MKSGSPVSTSDVKFALLFVACAVLLMSLWLAADRASAQTGDDVDDDGAAQNQYSENEDSDETCPNPAELFTIESQTENRVVPFEVTGRTFRVTYSVDFMDDEDLSNSLDIAIEDDSGLEVDFETPDEDQEEGSFIVTEGPGSFQLVTDVFPDDSATYTVSIEDCVGGATDNGNDNDQTNNDPQNDVITTTIPDKILVNTGGETASSGTPIMAALLGAAALSGVFGAAMLRLGRRRG